MPIATGRAGTTRNEIGSGWTKKGATTPFAVASPCDAHHLRFAQTGALGRKVSDEFTVPLCRGHHRELHRHGDQAVWWRTLGLDPTPAARTLWLQTHPLGANKFADVAADPGPSNDVSPANR
jgi:hypothetical protein